MKSTISSRTPLGLITSFYFRLGKVIQQVSSSMAVCRPTAIFPISEAIRRLHG